MNKELRPQQATPEGAPNGTPTRRLDTSTRLLPQKAISPVRDRQQSRRLTAVLGLALALGTLLSLPTLHHGSIPSRSALLSAVLISTLFATVVSLLRAATPGAALAGGVVCLLLTLWTAAPSLGSVPPQILHTALTPLILLFVCTFIATRSGRRRKAAGGLAESRHGRTASQVLANLAAAALCASACGIASDFDSLASGHGSGALQLAGKVLSLAALAEATADTVSSEIGQAFGGQPRMLLSLRPAKVGADGAITALGTIAGILSALLIALGGQWAMRLSPAQAIAAATGGILGLFVDSLLGATVERRGWFGNDLVNFSSTLSAALVAACIDAFARQ